MHDFWIALEHNDLKDLGHVGNFFTWNNKHETNTFTKERLYQFGQGEKPIS